MKVSLNWLKEYVDIDVDAKALGDLITKSGVEVDSVSKFVDATNLVIGKVLTKKPHPDSDHLSICEVDLGNEVKQIVCGASNVDVNQKVIVAKVGANLPGGKIKEVLIRGVKSEGMICALSELGIENKFIEEEYRDGIYVLKDEAKVGENPLEFLGFDDYVLELDLTPNRGDCLSMLGVAYEVGAILNKEVRYPKINYQEVKDNIEDYLSLKVETENCPLYIAKMVRDVEIKESSQFIKSALIKAGIRPINNVVDITNYVLLELGQPLHAFDYEKLGKNIVVRMAKENEKMTTLDGILRTFNKDAILITNGKEPVAIAGIMGGLDTEVTNNTKTVVLESAIFDPRLVRITANKLGLRSESSNRFEKGLDWKKTKMAIDRAAHLLEKYANGKVLSGTLIHSTIDKKEKLITVTKEKINSVLGTNLTTSEIKNILERLKFNYECKNETFKIQAPSRRPDISIPEDIIEEIGRIYGYDNIPSNIPTLNYLKEIKDTYKFSKTVTEIMKSLGLNQTMTYTLVSEEKIENFNLNKLNPIKLINPLSEERKYLRLSIIPSLLEVIEYNQARSVNNIYIFEVANTYYYGENNEIIEDEKLAIALTGEFLSNSWQNELVKVDFYILKALIEALFKRLNLISRVSFKPINNNVLEFHPGKTANILIDGECVGVLGEISPTFTDKKIYVAEISLTSIRSYQGKEIKVKELPKYPAVTRDVSFIFDDNITSDEIIKTIKQAGGKTLKSVTVFDKYKGENLLPGQYSFALNLVFQDYEKTQSDEEINELMKKIIKTVESKLKAKLRS